MKRILFFTFLTVFLISFAILSSQKTDEEVIKERLLEMGYPEHGYVIVNDTIRYPDGSFVVLSTPPVKYPIGGVEAYHLAQKYLDEEYNEKLEKYDYHLTIDPGSIEEYNENGNYYWAFKLYFGKGSSKGDFMGYILVDRESGYCKIKGLFGG